MKRTTLAVAGLAAVAAVLMWMAPRRSQATAGRDPKASLYVDPAVCAGCHPAVSRAYQRAGMARSFYRPTAANTVEDYRVRNRIYNQASDRYYTMIERDGKWYQRRHQVGFGGVEDNVVEKPVDYVMGSGNHVRSYLSRTPEGKLVELPVSWYAEKGGYWAMSPGYDSATQPDFRRAIVNQCMACHNRYLPPDQITVRDGSEPVFGERISEGIDCQRCHGPGREHVERAGSGRATADAIRSAIVNPARLSRDRQLDVCMQCHLETTIRPLPGWIPRDERAQFTFKPGEPLGDAFLFFDRVTAAGTDRFEIVHAAYRLRQSKCFQASAMTCTTCHNPHEESTGADAARKYAAVCGECHASAHAGSPKGQGSCIDCHMPRRRTEDVVHAVMTDHYIQRVKPARDLLAPLNERDFASQSYRGEVVPYYGASQDDRLYTDVAQVHDGSNLTAGIARLEADLGKAPAARPEFYFELGKAYATAGSRDQAVRSFAEAIRLRPEFEAALVEMGTALIGQGDLARAATVLEQAASLPSADTTARVNLAELYLRQGNTSGAAAMLQRAIAIEPDSPEARNLLGLTLGQQGDLNGAEREFRQAIAVQPDLAEAHYNLGRLLTAKSVYPEARFQFEKAIAGKHDYAEAHHSYGLLLVLMNAPDQAVAELRTALRLKPNDAEIHSDLGEVLTYRGHAAEAAEQFTQALALNPGLDGAHLGLGMSLQRAGHALEAREHLQKAAVSSNPDIRAAATAALSSNQNSKRPAN